MKLDRDIVTKVFSVEVFEELVDDLITEIKLRNYQVTRVNNIDNIHKRKEFGGQPGFGFSHYKIIEFCNLNSCSSLIDAHPLAGVFMPVRFIAFKRSHEIHTSVAFLKPTVFARYFESDSLLRIAEEMEKDMNDVLEEVAF